MTISKILLSLTLFIFSFVSVAEGNRSNDSFTKAKTMLERQVYQDHRLTLYCGAKFDAKKNIEAPEGFVTTTHLKRAKKVEWEHVYLLRTLAGLLVNGVMVITNVSIAKESHLREESVLRR